VIFDGQHLACREGGHVLAEMPDAVRLIGVPKLGFNLPGLTVYGEALSMDRVRGLAILDSRARRADGKPAMRRVERATSPSQAVWASGSRGVFHAYGVDETLGHVFAEVSPNGRTMEQWTVTDGGPANADTPFSLADLVEHGTVVQFPDRVAFRFDASDGTIADQRRRAPVAAKNAPLSSMAWLGVPVTLVAGIALWRARRRFFG
jgi:hypothetical protein